MQSDDLGLVERLRARTFSRWESDVQSVMEYEDELAAEAAAAIERLVAERDRLAEALKPFRQLANCTDSEPDGASVIVNVNRARDARQALKDAP